MKNEIPPFHIGQKVAILIDGKDHKKGDTFTIKNIWKHCCIWLCDIGLVCYCNFEGACCHGHILTIYKGGVLPVESTLLSPIISNFEAISFSQVLEDELVCVN